MRKSFKIPFYICCFFSLNFFCKYFTDDFSTHFLIPPAEAGSQWDIDQTPQNLNELLSQEYTYLAKGKQSYVFLSQDKKHVLKLFKPLAPFLEIPFFEKKFHIGLAKLPFFKSLLIDYTSSSFKQTQALEFQSYINSLHLLPEETQLEYLHLASSSHLQKKLKIYDKIGVLHTINLDSTSFLIQKKTDLLYPTLSKLVKNKEVDQAKELLNNFVHFYFHLIEIGIVNPTTLEKNLGCLGLKPIQIDVGRILTPHNLNLSDSKVPLTQIYLSTSHMKKWLARNAPELSNYFKKIEKEMLEAKQALQ